ncbi:replication initiation protein [Domibacillus sp. PGB-M46]|uniref:replication initiation protein n=1 Tax=Domibacillus sp. PGB-M46 TaxID=2910255 RepID=UPI001F59F076|nr:replication initiation protein [Domibacillus sp. PGB-M46]MCI2256213.1 replication initiation protein [Domibacillus sp. PGB-M46]
MAKKKENKALVVQSNDLIEAYYEADLKMSEHKIIRYAASKIKLNDTQFPHYSFEVSEFLAAAGVKGNNYHKEIEKIADGLSKRRIKVKSKEKIGWFPWFSGIVYEKGTVHIVFNALIKDLLLQLEERFTNYPFDVIAPLKSSYSVRLFELLKQYEKIGHRTIALEELRLMLGVTEKYPEYGNFKQRILKHSQKELKEKTNLSFEFEEIKQGKKVEKIKFTINSQYKQEQLALFNESDQDKEEQEKPAVYGEFVRRTKRLLKEQGIFVDEETISAWEKYGDVLMLEVLNEIKGRNIKQHVRYIEKVLLAKYEEQNKLSRIEGAQPEDMLQHALDAIIAEYQNSAEMVPNWFVEDKAVEILKERLNISDKEARKHWKKHKDELMNSIREMIKLRSKTRVRK